MRQMTERKWQALRGAILRSGPLTTMLKPRGTIQMQRLKTTGNPPSPRPSGSWLAGMLIGSAIMTMAAQAMVLGVSAAIQDAAWKGR
jgi:hypothetical protein